MTTGGHYIDYVLEQLSSLRGITSGRFFGGIGLAADGVQFGMVMDGLLYFVVDDTTRPKYEQMGSSCFSYDNGKRRVDIRKYYAVPAGVIEDPEELAGLARESIRVAESAKLKMTARPKRTRVRQNRASRSR